MKKKRNQSYIQQRIDANWLKTASPLLYRTKKREPNKVVDQPKKRKKKKKLTKSQRKLYWKALHTKKKKTKRVTPKYSVYILSKEWRTRCKEFYARYGRRCAACGDTEKIHLHHMSYRHLGNEEDGELAPLCKYCHKEYHELNGVQSDMIEKTVAFIEYKRQISMWG